MRKTECKSRRKIAVQFSFPYYKMDIMLPSERKGLEEEEEVE